MSIAEKFKEQPWATRLARRANNFLFMLEHLDKLTEEWELRPTIVETGTAWHEDNYEGQGQSTLIFDWYASQQYTPNQIISIDIRPEASEYAAKHAKHVQFIVSDSVKALSKLYGTPNPGIDPVGLLYLDSFDWTPEMNMASSVHHLCELTACYASLPEGCLIVVDDRHGNDAGKHLLVEHFFKLLGKEPAFKNHQIGWIK